MVQMYKTGISILAVVCWLLRLLQDPNVSTGWL